VQSLYVDIAEDVNQGPSPIHLGFKSGTKYLIDFLKLIESLGVNHVILNLKFGSRSAEDMIEEIGQNVMPFFE
jgi:hypothetical protein